MRLTCKTANGYCDMSIATRENKLQKLGQLEDFEDKLGIDLITLLKALTKGFYTRWEDLGLITDATLVPGLYPEFKFVRDDSVYFYLLKDYGETWALTKEELL